MEHEPNQHDDELDIERLTDPDGGTDYTRVGWVARLPLPTFLKAPSSRSGIGGSHLEPDWPRVAGLGGVGEVPVFDLDLDFAD